MRAWKTASSYLSTRSSTASTLTGDGKRYRIQCSTAQIEEGTSFHARYRQSLLKPLHEEVEIEAADRIQSTLAQASLER